MASVTMGEWAPPLPPSPSLHGGRRGRPSPLLPRPVNAAVGPAATSEWIQFFKEAGIPPGPAVNYAVTFVDNRRVAPPRPQGLPGPLPGPAGIETFKQ